MAGDVDPVAALFPVVPRSRGHYESFYVKACAPGGRRAVWIRYTVHKRPGHVPTGSLWCTLFDHDAAGPRALKQTLPAPHPLAGGGIAVGRSRLSLDEISGSASAAGRSAAWDLRIEGGEEPMAHLPAQWMYRTRVPRTKVVTLRPAARVRGRVVIDDVEIAVDAWDGVINHNWGSEHAERWIWVHGAAGGDWIDVVIARVRIGRWTTPWIANGAISIDGRRHALGGPARVRRTRVEESPTHCSLRLAGAGVTVEGEVSAPAADFVAWKYYDPDGGEHDIVNCSICDLSLMVERVAEPPRRLEIDGAAAYELGMREDDHGIPVQPFPDG
jgi:hypothetical protein